MVPATMMLAPVTKRPLLILEDIDGPPFKDERNVQGVVGG